MKDYHFTDNTEASRYELRDGEVIAKIDYVKTKNGRVYLTHTEVSYGWEGKGIGSRIVEQALADIRRQGLKVVPSCPFVAAYIRQHPEWECLAN